MKNNFQQMESEEDDDDDFVQPPPPVIGNGDVDEVPKDTENPEYNEDEDSEMVHDKMVRNYQLEFTDHKLKYL